MIYMKLQNIFDLSSLGDLITNQLSWIEVWAIMQLEYIGYARKPISRSERVRQAEDNIYSFINAEQKDFIDFVLHCWKYYGFRNILRPNNS